MDASIKVSLSGIRASLVVEVTCVIALTTVLSSGCPYCYRRLMMTTFSAHAVARFADAHVLGQVLRVLLLASDHGNSR